MSTSKPLTLIEISSRQILYCLRIHAHTDSIWKCVREQNSRRWVDWDKNSLNAQHSTREKEIQEEFLPALFGEAIDETTAITGYVELAHHTFHWNIMDWLCQTKLIPKRQITKLVAISLVVHWTMRTFETAKHTQTITVSSKSSNPNIQITNLDAPSNIPRKPEADVLSTAARCH